MNNRGQGRVFQRGSLLWIAYYAHGKEQREVARHVRTGEKLEATTEKNRHEADRFLKHRLGEIAAEKHGGRPFVGPQQERVTVNELLDGLNKSVPTGRLPKPGDALSRYGDQQGMESGALIRTSWVAKAIRISSSRPSAYRNWFQGRM